MTFVAGKPRHRAVEGAGWCYDDLEGLTGGQLTAGTNIEEAMNSFEVAKAAGLWTGGPEAYAHMQVIRAFYRRPWKGDCSMDQICDWSAQENIDPYPLMKMLSIVGELREDI